MKGVGGINDNKNIVLPPQRFVTPTHNAFVALAKNDNNDNNNDDILYTSVSVL